MGRHPVFLVIDNISDDEASRDEARAYLKAGFHPDSLIMITSRSQDIVKALFNDSESKYCKAMPNLTEEEAGIIFLQRAAPQRTLATLSDAEREILKLCLDQCRYPNPHEGQKKRNIEDYRQYHPLALRALAVYFFEIDNNNLLSWKKNLYDDDKLKLSRESSEIFRILGLQFSTFDKKKKLIFLDVALHYSTFWRSQEHDNKQQIIRSGSFEWYHAFLDVEYYVIWLAEIHEERTRAMECQVSVITAPVKEVKLSFIMLEHTYVYVGSAVGVESAQRE